MTKPHTRNDVIPKCQCGQRPVAIRYGKRWMCMICATEKAEEDARKRVDNETEM
jgi:hypothetical protein